MHDNIYADADQRVSDLVLTLAPSLAYTFERDGALLSLHGDAVVGSYASHDEEDYLDARIGLKGERDFGRLRLFGGVEHAWEHDSRDSPEDAFGIEPVTYTRLGGNAGAEIAFAPFTLRLGGLVDRFDFDDVDAASGAVIDGDRRDRTESEIGLRLTRDIGEGRGVFVQGALDLRDYDESVGVDRDARGWNAAAGVGGTLLSGGFGSLEGELLAGVMTLDRDDPALKDAVVPDLGIDLTWRPEPGTAFHAEFARSLEETTVSRDGVPASGYVATALRMRVERAASERLRVGAWTGLVEQDFAGIDRIDRILSFGAEARYQLTEHVWIGPALVHEQRRSNVAGEDYAAQSLLLRIGASPTAAWDGAAPPPYEGEGEFYVGAQAGFGMFGSSQSGVRGSDGTVEGGYVDDSLAAGLFAGWRSISNGVVLGAEAEVELAEALCRPGLRRLARAAGRRRADRRHGACGRRPRLCSRRPGDRADDHGLRHGGRRRDR